VDVERGQQRGTGLAGAVDGDPGYPGGDDAAIEAPAEVARLDRSAVPGGEDQAGIDPAITSAATIGVLLLPAGLECRQAQVGQRQRCFRGLGLNLAADELVTHALELFPDVQLGVIEVNLIPGQAEDFTPPQAEDKDQDEGGAERFTGMPG
jgi:hypothetical protein